MFVTTRRATILAVDIIADAVLWGRRMTSALAIADVEAGVLRGEIMRGSSWAALRLAIKCRPDTFAELLAFAHVSQPPVLERAFDACVDGYAVYRDARRRGKL